MSIPFATLHPKTLDFTATVLESTLDDLVELSQTYFYPTSGGQPHDLGTLTRGDETFQVLDVVKRDGKILHKLDRQGLQLGDEVAGQIDGARREAHRRVHTATHVLCSVLERTAGTQITGNQLGAEKSRIDVNLTEYTPEGMQIIVDEANRLLAQQLPVRRRVTTRDELLANPSLVKLAAGFPEHVTEVHLVEIGDIDAQPCGGTHADNTSECGKITFLKGESRGKNNRRIYFTVE